MSEDLIKQMAKDIHVIRDLLSKFVNAQHEAESEVHEKMRRFTMYMHCVKDIRNMYIELGQMPPAYINEEVQRLDDRFRQLLAEAHSDGNTFEQVRRKMVDDPDNRWDHTRAIGVQK